MTNERWWADLATLHVRQGKALHGITKVPGDKSISHRAIMLGSLAEGATEIHNFLASEDCLHTVKCFRQLGVHIDINDQRIVVQGQGLHGLTEAHDVLDVGNSGTTIRLLSGILAGQPFASMVTGDVSIRRRPMGRITDPLRQMGATIIGRNGGTLAPLAIHGGNLHGVTYTTEVASAQVKSAILLAGLLARGHTEVTEPQKSRNHTEVMLRGFGAQVVEEGLTVRLCGGQVLKGCTIEVPGDISSAAFLLVAALILEGSSIRLQNVGLNPTRTGIIDVLRQMGGDITIENSRISGGEAIGDIQVRSARLRGTVVCGAMIPRIIDEIPVLAVAGCFAHGVTEIRDAEELKVKESNRIATIIQELHKLGAVVEELPDGLRIKGPQKLHGAVVQSHGDHRIALALAVAGLKASDATTVLSAEAIAVSFPSFQRVLTNLGGEVLVDANTDR